MLLLASTVALESHAVWASATLVNFAFASSKPAGDSDHQKKTGSKGSDNNHIGRPKEAAERGQTTPYFVARWELRLKLDHGLTGSFGLGEQIAIAP